MGSAINMASVAKTVGGFGQLRIALKRWAFRMSGYNQYGLYHDDVLYENHDVQEALRRLPQSLKDDRTFRMTRALHLSMPKDILPSYEEDHSTGRYLQPYLKEVVQERKERE